MIFSYIHLHFFFFKKVILGYFDIYHSMYQLLKNVIVLCLKHGKAKVFWYIPWLLQDTPSYFKEYNDITMAHCINIKHVQKKHAKTKEFRYIPLYLKLRYFDIYHCIYNILHGTLKTPWYMSKKHCNSIVLFC